jgi:hypothetical protein
LSAFACLPVALLTFAERKIEAEVFGNETVGRGTSRCVALVLLAVGAALGLAWQAEAQTGFVFEASRIRFS